MIMEDNFEIDRKGNTTAFIIGIVLVAVLAVLAVIML